MSDRKNRNGVLRRTVALAALAGSMVMGGAVTGRAVVPDARAAESANAVKPERAEPARKAKVDINKASARQLEALPGIGPALAARIVAYRNENGKFRRIEELMNVKGVGEKSFARFKDRITVGG